MKVQPSIKLDDAGLVMGAWSLSAIGLLLGLCFPLPLIGLVLARRASGQGIKNARGALIFSSLCLALTTIVFGGWAAAGFPYGGL